jgi:hypothetical protein
MIDVRLGKRTAYCITVKLWFVFPQQVTKKDLNAASLIAPYHELLIGTEFLRRLQSFASMQLLHHFVSFLCQKV